jgi:hypothetical protein
MNKVFIFTASLVLSQPVLANQANTADRGSILSLEVSDSEESFKFFKDYKCLSRDSNQGTGSDNYADKNWRPGGIQDCTIGIIFVNDQIFRAFPPLHTRNISCRYINSTKRARCSFNSSSGDYVIEQPVDASILPNGSWTLRGDAALSLTRVIPLDLLAEWEHHVSNHKEDALNTRQYIERTPGEVRWRIPEGLTR